jgi:DNA-binding transcriptional LysR family regulator
MIDDIRYLIVFAKVAEAGSFSAGAEALGLTTATASAHVSRLERSLGTALLYRNTRRLSLTRDGATVLETARGMLSLYQSGLGAFKGASAGAREALRVAIPAALMEGPFMAALAAFIVAHPELDISLRCRDSREDVVGESIDVAFRIGELADSSLKARKVFTLARQVVAAPSLLKNRRTPGHPGELSDLPWIGLSMRPNLRTFVSATGERCEIRYRPVVEVDSIEAAFHLSMLGTGLSAPPIDMSRAAIARGDLVTLVPDWSQEPLKVSALWPANVPASSSVHRLVDAMCESMRVQEVSA